MNSNNDSSNDLKLNNNVIRRFVQIIITIIIFALILFLSSGNYTWFWAWLFIGLYVVYTIFNSFLLPKELIAERGKTKDNVKTWDKILTKIAFLPGLGTILVCGLDERYNWTSDYSIYINIISILFFLLGNVIVTWSMLSNKFFSTHVRIQSDRRHIVQSGGPYKLVRHPGYVGMILNSLFTPLILGSYWGLIPALLMVLIFIIRTSMEDRTLQNELEGYKEFSQKVKYKLFPGIW